MSHNNYSKYSNKNNNHQHEHEIEIHEEILDNIEQELTITNNEEIIINTNVDEPVVETTAGLVQIVEEEPIVAEEQIVVEEQKQSVTGYVKEDCALLNVRKEPSIESSKVDVIKKLDEVIIDLENSSNDFYKVKTSEGIEGYCMKKFINIK